MKTGQSDARQPVLAVLPSEPMVSHVVGDRFDIAVRSGLGKFSHMNDCPRLIFVDLQGGCADIFC